MMDLKNKRVLVVGLGKSGLSAAMFLRAQGARVTVSDTRSAVALEKEIPALLEAGIMVESGGHGLLTFRRQDLIVVSPGVPMDTPEVKQVVAFGLPVIGELELASRYLQGRVVAITGSNGKTTTTTLMGKIFADAGVATSTPGGASPNAAGDRKIVRSGELGLIVQGPAEVAEKIRLLAETQGGFLVSSEVSGGPNATSGSLTIRVPEARFEETWTSRPQLQCVRASAEGKVQEEELASCRATS